MHSVQGTPSPRHDLSTEAQSAAVERPYQEVFDLRDVLLDRPDPGVRVVQLRVNPVQPTLNTAQAVVHLSEPFGVLALVLAERVYSCQHSLVIGLLGFQRGDPCLRSANVAGMAAMLSAR